MSFHLDWSDYTVITSVLLVCSLLGLYFKRKYSHADPLRRDGLSEFLFANRSLSVLPAAISIGATSMSAYSLTGVTGELYLYGFQHALAYISLIFSIGLGAYYFIPVYRDVKCISVFQLVEDRFDGSVRRIFSLFYLINRLMFLSMVLYLPALSLTTITPFDYRLTTFVLGFVCTAYSSFGGFRTVIWTDILQWFLILFTLLMVIFQGATRMGSVGDIWQKSLDNGFLTTVYWTEGETTRYSIWGPIVGSLFGSVDYFLINQAMIQRVLAAKSDTVARNSMILGAIILSLMGLLLMAGGAVMYMMYNSCDPLQFPEISGVKRVDQLFVYAIGDLFKDYSFLKGVAISGIISASLSTFSSYINAFAALILDDFLKPIFPKHTMNESFNVKICIGISFFCGCLATFLSFLMPFFGNAVRALDIILGSFRGPMGGVAVLVFFYKKLTKKACLFALAVGMMFMAFIILGNLLYIPTPNYSSLSHTTDGCKDFDIMEINWVDNSTDTEEINFTIVEDIVEYGNQTSVPVKVKDGVFYPFFKISFIWYNTIGFFVSFLVGIIFSEISITCQDKERPTKVQRSYSQVEDRNSDEKRITENMELI